MRIVAALTLGLCAGCGAQWAALGPKQARFVASSLDRHAGRPHVLVLEERALQLVVDRIIDLAKSRDLVLVSQDCHGSECSLALRGKPIDRRIFRGTESQTLSYYSRYFLVLRAAARRIDVSAIGVPVLGGEMACPPPLAPIARCAAPQLEYSSDAGLISDVRRQWGYDVSGATEAEMLQGLFVELRRGSAVVERNPADTRPALSAPSVADQRAYAELRLAGQECYRRRDYRCALDRFRRAQSRAPSAEMRFNIASAEDKLGLPVLALRDYQAYLRQATRVPPAAAQHIARRMTALASHVGQIRVALQPAQATVALNGTPQPRDRPLVGVAAVELVVEPGTHQLDFSCAGYRPVSHTVTLLAGETKQLEVLLRP